MSANFTVVPLGIYRGVGIPRTGIPRTTWEYPGQTTVSEKNLDIPDFLLKQALFDKNYNFVVKDFKYQHGNTSDNVGIPRTMWEYPGQLFRSEMSGVFQSPCNEFLKLKKKMNALSILKQKLDVESKEDPIIDNFSVLVSSEKETPLLI